jgi:hypothetical protein
VLAVLAAPVMARLRPRLTWAAAGAVLALSAAAEAVEAAPVMARLRPWLTWAAAGAVLALPAAAGAVLPLSAAAGAVLVVEAAPVTARLRPWLTWAAATESLMPRAMLRPTGARPIPQSRTRAWMPLCRTPLSATPPSLTAACPTGLPTLAAIYPRR